ncbi:KAP family P-loop NTPase fold protein [Tritonibacter scottomollicae]|uniref:KAP-like P-loop domain-containing protein n=1 Tax=Tritonibacter scottomollicae TaxID=483013 RepID=A0A2T1AIF2_TRISK|nr:P-loop NTPase fold protein [Tritonibacter scottomollicae]PRZ48317.1 KAP-like P-loop domain-containing protein [Tritonibacter scottomollicae]
MAKELDSDRAVEVSDNDEFGFVGIAEKLAPRVVEASKGDGMVIGLEGRWGSGKTSLVNFLRSELKGAEAEHIHTITVAPWLNGDTASLVNSVLEPIADVLHLIENEAATPEQQAGAEIAENVGQIRELISTYGSQTARKLAPVATLAGYALPGMQAAGEVLGAAAALMDNMAERPLTPTALKAEIIEKIRALDVGFVVILDDLDRLEPAQAVEVVRLVRSVADFPKVAYLMCYDRDVLADALSEGLKVKDGDLFLQKIVQLTFAIPLPEPFDLRTQFRQEVLKLYKELQGIDLAGDALEDLESAVDQEGQGLATPREVKLALNGIRFTYPSVKDDVYFPDFCRLHLIKTTHFKFYKWLESYLSVRSIIVSGDGRVGADEKKRCGKELKALLPSQKPDSARSIWHASNFVPGIEARQPAKDTVFAATPQYKDEEFVSLKRLGSPFHYRFYFALTGPKTIMSDADIDEALHLSREDVPGLIESLAGYAKTTRQSGRTWFEHILDRLEDRVIGELDEEQLSGMVTGICEVMDTVLEIDNVPRFFAPSLGRLAGRVVGECLRRLNGMNPERHHKLALWIAAECSSINWIVGGLLRTELFHHGHVGNGDQRTSPEEWVFSEDLLQELLDIARKRISDQELQGQILAMPDVSGFMYGWRDISGEDEPKAWVTQVTIDDEVFLQFLQEMRGYAVSDRVYYPLHQQTLEIFFEDADAVVDRVESLVESEHAAEARNIRDAIKQGEGF